MGSLVDQIEFAQHLREDGVEFGGFLQHQPVADSVDGAIIRLRFGLCERVGWLAPSGRAGADGNQQESSCGIGAVVEFCHLKTDFHSHQIVLGAEVPAPLVWEYVGPPARGFRKPKTREGKQVLLIRQIRGLSFASVV